MRAMLVLLLAMTACGDDGQGSIDLATTDIAQGSVDMNAGDMHVTAADLSIGDLAGYDLVGVDLRTSVDLSTATDLKTAPADFADFPLQCLGSCCNGVNQGGCMSDPRLYCIGGACYSRVGYPCTSGFCESPAICVGTEPRCCIPLNGSCTTTQGGCCGTLTCVAAGGGTSGNCQ
jgi:hypothetical protein